jgi:lipopolysaccharide/colanic/teichoic acid biosynthesis glycosyltransferase
MRLIEALTTWSASPEYRDSDPWSRAGEVPEVQSNRPDEVGQSEWPTRALNFTLALVALVALLPVFVLLAVLVKLTSRGPVFYLQERVGLDRRGDRPAPTNHRRRHDLGGRPFTIYKFRTMQVDAERHSGAVWATAADPRVTPLGRVLRQYRLDELPQLLNVLRGDMTLVGPRPETVALARRYPPECRWVLEHTPGLTGPAQIRLRDARVLALRVERGATVDPERWYLEDVVPRRVELDATYLREPSLLRTVVVLVQTAVYLLRPQ